MTSSYSDRRRVGRSHYDKRRLETKRHRTLASEYRRPTSSPDRHTRSRKSTTRDGPARIQRNNSIGRSKSRGNMPLSRSSLASSTANKQRSLRGQYRPLVRGTIRRLPSRPGGGIPLSRGTSNTRRSPTPTSRRPRGRPPLSRITYNTSRSPTPTHQRPRGRFRGRYVSVTEVDWNKMLSRANDINNSVGVGTTSRKRNSTSWRRLPGNHYDASSTDPGDSSDTSSYISDGY